MDLLIGSLRRYSTAAVLATAVVLLCACQSGTGDTPEGPTASEEPAVDGATALPKLQPVRPDEVAIGARSGVGPALRVLAGSTDDVVVVYGVCSQESAEMTLTLTLPRPELLTVPCDGVVSRAQVFTNTGESFGVDVEGPSDLTWKVFVSARSE